MHRGMGAHQLITPHPVYSPFHFDAQSRQVLSIDQMDNMAPAPLCASDDEVLFPRHQHATVGWLSASTGKERRSVKDYTVIFFVEVRYHCLEFGQITVRLIQQVCHD